MAERLKPAVKAVTAVGLVGAGALGGIAVTGGFGENRQAPVADRASVANLLSPTPTLSPSGEPTLKFPFPTPTVTETAKAPTLKELGSGVSVSGIKSSVEVSVVDVANPKFGFVNTWNNGTEGFLADDGKVLVGPEFPQDIIDSSKGAIDRKHEYNSKMFTSGIPEHWPLPEGGFSVVMFGGGTITYGDKVMNFEHEEGRTYMVILRGPNADRQQDSDLNGTFTITDYVAGHAVAQNYDGNPHGGFISQKHFEQMIQNAHNNLRAGSQNCGAEGCSEVVIPMLDVNTDAMAVVKHVDVLADGEAAHPVAKVDPVYSNFPTRK